MRHKLGYKIKSLTLLKQINTKQTCVILNGNAVLGFVVNLGLVKVS